MLTFLTLVALSCMAVFVLQVITFLMITLDLNPPAIMVATLPSSLATRARPDNGNRYMETLEAVYQAGWAQRPPGGWKSWSVRQGALAPFSLVAECPQCHTTTVHHLRGDSEGLILRICFVPECATEWYQEKEAGAHKAYEEAAHRELVREDAALRAQMAYEMEAVRELGAAVAKRRKELGL